VGSLEAMGAGSEKRCVWDAAATAVKVAQGVSGAVTNKGTLQRHIPHLMQGVRHGLQDAGIQNVEAAPERPHNDTSALRDWIACSSKRRWRSRTLQLPEKPLLIGNGGHQKEQISLRLHDRCDPVACSKKFIMMCWARPKSVEPGNNLVQISR
jgi:hypothetical protein